VDSGRPKEPRIRFGPGSPPGEEAIFRVVLAAPLKMHCNSESAENGYINYTIYRVAQKGDIPPHRKHLENSMTELSGSW